MKTIRLRSLRPVYRREVLREDAPDYLSSRRYNSPEQVFDLFRDMANESREVFVCLHLDTKLGLLCFDRVSVGTVNTSLVHPGEVFKGALLSGAAAIILIHNHPSGDPAPSEADRAVTKRLVEAGKMLDVRVVDHVVVGEGRYYSFSENGELLSTGGSFFPL